MSFDILIRGGTVCDGTGRPPEEADIAVADGRIVEIGRCVYRELYPGITSVRLIHEQFQLAVHLVRLDLCVNAGVKMHRLAGVKVHHG